MAKRTDTPATVDELSAETIVGAFGLAPADAIRFFERLGVSIDWNWRADLEQARAIAFTLAKVTDLQVLAAVKEEIARALMLGIPQAQFRRFLEGRLAALGWLGQREQVQPDGSTAIADLSTPARQNTIYRTNMQTAYMVGRYQAQMENVDAEPFGQYVAVMDGRTRHTHAAMNGRVYRLTDPVWQKIYPPCGYNCRCRVRTLTAEQVEARGLIVLDGATAPLPQGFPDPGFGQNNAAPGVWLNMLTQLAGEARTSLNSAPAAMRPT